MSRRGIDLYCVQECRWRGASARMIGGKDSRYKCFWICNELGTGGVGVLLAVKWIDKLFDVKRVRSFNDDQNDCWGSCGCCVIGICPSIWAYHS